MDFSESILKFVKAESYVSNKVEKCYIDKKGYGLFAKEKIKKGEIVSISGGLILTTDEFKSNIAKYGDYSYFIEEGFVICALNQENPSDDWRMNHCCEPNCGVKGQIVFVALRDIEKSEELTYDYAMTESDPDYEVELYCDKGTCRKKCTGSDWVNTSIQEKYKGYFSLYIQKKIDELKTQ